MNRINPNDFIAWLTTQQNSRGSLYLDRVARHYTRYLKTAPTKLDIPLSAKEREVFACTTTAKFDEMCNAFLAAPNYKAVNADGHQSFSAALKCFARYLEHLANSNDDFGKDGSSVVEQTTAASRNLDYSFTYPGAKKTYAYRDVAEQNAIKAGLQVSDVYQVNKPATAFANIAAKSSLEYSFTYSGATRTYAHKDVAEQNALRAGLQISDVYQVSEPATAFGGLSQAIVDAKKNTVDATVTEPCATFRTTTVVPIVDKETCEALDIVLDEKFSNGFRCASDIEIGRLRKFASELLGREIILSDNDVVEYVKSKGTEHEGKVYIVDAKTVDRIHDLAEDYFDSGAIAILYAEFYTKNESWLFEASVISEVMLKDILRTRFSQLNFTSTYCGKTKESVYNVLRSEISRVWADDILMTYERLSERLMYIPQWRIEQFLGNGNSGDYIWNSTGEYTHASKINITDCEIKGIVDFVESEINAHGYASMADVPLGKITEHNHELSRTAIHNGIFYICLADKYGRRGKLITRKGDSIDALYIVKEYCGSRDKATLDELLAFEYELTGEIHRWIPMQAGYDIMIRIDEQNFIAEQKVHFDIDVIDSAIEDFMNGNEYVPLQHITNFAKFDHCGIAWNLFLLESYAWRFSRSFRFDTRAVNSKNVGAIVRKHSRITYDDIMADFVARTSIELSAQNTLNCLLENGLVSNRKHKDIDGLMSKAKMIREGRG